MRTASVGWLPSTLSLDPSAVQAAAAASLAPGSLEAVEAGRSGALDSLSDGLPVRSVVLRVDLIGLGDLHDVLAGEETREDALASPSGSSSGPACPEACPATALSDDVFGVSEGRVRRVGRDSSGYVIAGTVPPPIHPRAGGSSEDRSSGPVGGMTSSSRDDRKASSRSMRSLHNISSWRRLSVRALSVSDCGTPLGGGLPLA